MARLGSNETSPIEIKIKEAYADYLELPLATITDDRNSELYKNGWVIILGLGFCYPDPHRHYNLTEFAYYIGNNAVFRERFMK